MAETVKGEEATPSAVLLKYVLRSKRLSVCVVGRIRIGESLRAGQSRRRQTPPSAAEDAGIDSLASLLGPNRFGDDGGHEAIDTHTLVLGLGS